MQMSNVAAIRLRSKLKLKKNTETLGNYGSESKVAVHYRNFCWFVTQWANQESNKVERYSKTNCKG